jgi:SpoVK/Ycf46/Vps4 family AAA+-type ATPase
MLTILDGIRPLSGAIIIMTTNCIEKLDEALIRDGRVDAIIELGKMNHRNMEKMLKKYYPEAIHRNYQMYDLKFTPALITSLIKSSPTYDDFINKLDNKFSTI